MSIISPWYQLGYVIPHLYTDLDDRSSGAPILTNPKA